MNLTLHLTADCNLACRYCYEKHTPARMDEATAFSACRLMFSFGHGKNGFSFFGGEPLLCRGLIERVTGYCEELNRERGGTLSYQMTTNGLLLDEGFLELADERRISVALSHDGVLQDDQRVRKDGSGTAAALEPKIDLLLSHQPNAIAMLTVMPENASRLAEAVEWLYLRGFSRINTALDYRPEVVWDEAALSDIGRCFGRIAGLCAEHYDDARPLRLLNLEAKMASSMTGKPCMECRLGVRQPSVAPDGTLYPCNQFLNDPKYRMGDVFSGIDAAAQRRIMREASADESSCSGCKYAGSCRHHCACLNHSMTGDMHKVPAVQCASEKLLIETARSLAEELKNRKSPRFMRAYGASIGS